jgi:polysaccharide biosynthesis transport protein
VATNIQFIDFATTGNFYKPKTLKNLVLASMLGLILGAGLALLVDSLDDSIKSPSDLEACKLPSLGMLPLLSSDGSRSLVARVWHNLPWLRHPKIATAELGDIDNIVYTNPKDIFSEAFRQTQTSLMLSDPGAPSAIIVTSSNPSEGKTVFASNLALSFALSGGQTVLIDCDLRKPRIYKAFKLNRQPGLTNYLTDTANLEEIFRSTPLPNLKVIVSGPQSPSPGNLLNSEIFKDLLVKLRQQFRYVIIDTPPILGFSDGRIISPLVDGVVLVTRYNFTNKKILRRTQQLLSQSNIHIMGAVINCIDKVGQRHSGYHYNYGSYYNSSD